MDEIGFFKAIQSGAVNGAYLLHGEEDYSKERAVQQCGKLVSDAAREMNVQQMKAPTADAVIAACETLPFFDRLRIVTVTELSADEAARLAPYAEKAPETTLLLIVYRGKAAATGALYKALGKADRVIEFPRCDTGRAAAFALKRAAEYGAVLGRPEAAALVDYAGVDMAALENAVLKLAAYVGPGRAITRGDIAACITPSPEYGVFEILERLVAGNLREGLAMLQNELQNGNQTPLQTAGFLEGRVKLMLRAKEMLSARMPETAIQKELGGSSYAAKKAIQSAKKSSLSRLRRAVTAFASVNAEVVRGSLREDDALLIAVYHSFMEESAV